MDRNPQNRGFFLLVTEILLYIKYMDKKEIMSNLINLTDLVPEVYKILTKAKDYGLETEVVAQMIKNSHLARPSEVIDRMWGALSDWDIPTHSQEDEYNQHLNNQMEG